MDNGLHSGILFKDYLKLDALNVSSIKHLNRSPAHMRWEKDHPEAPTAAKRIGSALHCAVLEPDLMDSVVAIAPDIPRRSGEQKQLWQTFERESRGKIILSLKEMETVHSMLLALRKHPEASRLLDGEGHRELTCIWQDPRGFPCKCRPDLVLTDDAILIDLKTCEDASPAGFARQCAKFYYHWQAAWYLRGMSIATKFAHTQFVLVAVEKAAPYGIGVYRMPAVYSDIGMDQMEPLLTLYGRCRETDHWPGYSTEAQMLRMPMWALRQPGEVD